MKQERAHYHEDKLQKAVDTSDRTGNISGHTSQGFEYSHWNHDKIAAE